MALDPSYLLNARRISGNTMLNPYVIFADREYVIGYSHTTADAVHIVPISEGAAATYSLQRERNAFGVVIKQTRGAVLYRLTFPNGEYYWLLLDGHDPALPLPDANEAARVLIRVRLCWRLIDQVGAKYETAACMRALRRISRDRFEITTYDGAETTLRLSVRAVRFATYLLGHLHGGQPYEEIKHLRNLAKAKDYRAIFAAYGDHFKGLSNYELSVVLSGTDKFLNGR